ncbi:hypothetical protein [Streptomyces sp. H27-H5]|uniref:hypothetical protein n=1 Tax=Streptomyces sp. H27-H5 TaxID=2996460 RepID=UPI0022701F64|nr:hypothetical protein [Streptomyces sp. H27-H5]MCY0957731.1 hypothetical protein [Streptomyces sp. H27-H5]
MSSPGRIGAPPTDLVLTVAVGTPTEEWCTACKAYTRLAGDLLILAPGGVSRIGTWTWCEICEDPRDRREERTRG